LDEVETYDVPPLIFLIVKVHTTVVILLLSIIRIFGLFVGICKQTVPGAISFIEYR